MNVKGKWDDLVKDIAIIPKHIRFSISSLGGGFLMFLAVAAPFDYVYITLPLLLLGCFFLVWFAIYENIDKIEWVMLFILPVLWALVWYVFFYMVPVRWLTRVLFGFIFSFIFYILLSVENIYNVGVEKNIQLQKAAVTVTTILMVGLSYMAFQIIASFELYFLIQSLLISGVSWIIALKFFWTNDPSLKILDWQLKLTNLVAVIMLFLSLIMSFWPSTAGTTRPVALVGIFYVLTNALSDSRDPIVFKQRSRELLVVAIAIVAIIFITLPR